MKVNIFNATKFVEINNLKEVSNPVMLENGSVPTSDGLFSYEIFGRPGSKDRKETFAYIDLGGHYFHPLVLKVLKRLNRKFEDCISGFGTFKITADGELVEDENAPEENTGLEFLYKNWTKLKFKNTNSIDRESRIKMISALNRDEAFMNKQIVIPCFYRDINFLNSDSGKLSHDEVNDKYTKLIRLVKSNAQNELGGLSFIGNSTKSNIQFLLVDIYEYFTGQIKGKNGVFHKFVMGKSIEYGVRTVISSPIYTAERYEDMQVKMDYAGVPLSQCCVTFFPFIRKWVSDFFQKNFGYRSIVQDRKKELKTSTKVLDYYTFDVITKYITNFTKSPSDRFNPVVIPTDDGDKNYYLKLDYETGEPMKRPMTWTDLLYMAAYDVCKDKHVYITRYPLTDYFGIYPSKINVLSTVKTQEITVNGIHYKNYPVIDLNTEKSRVGNNFIDAMQLPNVMCPALGADYDGK